jgi:hypothetical protein
MNITIKEQQISFETAKLARQKLFDWVCTTLYVMYNGVGTLRDCHYATTKNSDLDYGGVAASCSQTILQKWLREVHRVDVDAYSNASGYHWTLDKSFNIDWCSGGTHIANSDLTGRNAGGGWNSYEKALEEGLFFALLRLEV